jgi:membrane-bound lytic murein transglycosylase B
MPWYKAPVIILYRSAPARRASLARAAALAVLALSLAGPASAQSDFAACLDRLRGEATGRGVPAGAADQAFTGLQPDMRVVDYDSRQPEFSLTFGQYLRSSISDQRLQTGRQMLQRHQALLARVERDYGVPPVYLVAFWGIESNYGTFLGDFPVIRSLATLACYTRRAAFFGNELQQALRIVAQGRIAPAQMKGSWAGAMGNTQFLPSTYMTYGIDGDGDGKVDLWSSLPDVFASSANFLRGIGWQPGLPAQIEVRLPAGFPFEQADGVLEKPASEWQTQGVRAADGRPLPGGTPSSVLLPSGHRGPAFLLLPNFKAVMNWNRSQLYALTVGHLAQRLGGGPDLAGTLPADDVPLRREAILEMQRKLQAMGLYDDEIDGLVGPKTRAGIRKYQQRIGLPPDGHPTPDVIARLRTASP